MDLKYYRETIGEFYNDHFSEEEQEIIYEIMRGNVPLDALKDKLLDLYGEEDMPTPMDFTLDTDDNILDRLDYDIGYVGGVGTRSVYRPN